MRYDVGLEAKLGSAEPILSTPGFDGFSHAGSSTVRTSASSACGSIPTPRRPSGSTPERKKLQALADARFPGRVNTHRTAATAPVPARCSSTPIPTATPARIRSIGRRTQEWITIGKARQAVDPRQMATLDLHRIKARDGLDLPVWVTTPRGNARARRARQWFSSTAARGCAARIGAGTPMRSSWRRAATSSSSPSSVAAPASGGRTMHAGFRQGWGTTMQDDVADAVRWAAEKGLDRRQARVRRRRQLRRLRDIDGRDPPPRVSTGAASPGSRSATRGCCYEPILAQRRQPGGARVLRLPTLVGDLDQGRRAAEGRRRRSSAHGEIKVPFLMAFGAEDRARPPRARLAHARGDARRRGMSRSTWSTPAKATAG